MEENVAWTDAAPPEAVARGKFVLVVKYPNRYPIRFQGEPRRCYTHRIEGRTRPCLLDECPHCSGLEPTPRDWTAYAPIAVLAWKNGETLWVARILPLNANMYRAVAGRFTPAHEFVASRRNESPYAEIVIEPTSHPHEARMPKPLDARLTMLRCWKIADGQTVRGALEPELVEAAEIADEAIQASYPERPSDFFAGIKAFAQKAAEHRYDPSKTYPTVECHEQPTSRVKPTPDQLARMEAKTIRSTVAAREEAKRQALKTEQEKRQALNDEFAEACRKGQIK